MDATPTTAADVRGPPGLENYFEEGRLILEEEEWWVCPHHRSHKMPAMRLVAHVGTCKERVGKSSLYDRCPHNNMHYMRTGMLDRHIEVCNGRLMVKSGTGSASSCGRMNAIPSGTCYTQCRGCDSDIDFLSGECAVCFVLNPQRLTARVKALEHYLKTVAIPIKIEKQENDRKRLPEYIERPPAPVSEKRPRYSDERSISTEGADSSQPRLSRYDRDDQRRGRSHERHERRNDDWGRVWEVSGENDRLSSSRSGSGASSTTSGFSLQNGQSATPDGSSDGDSKSSILPSFVQTTPAPDPAPVPPLQPLPAANEGTNQSQPTSKDPEPEPYFYWE